MELETLKGTAVHLCFLRFLAFIFLELFFVSFVTVETRFSGLFRRKDHEYGFGGSNKLVAPPSVRDRKKRTDEN